MTPRELEDYYSPQALATRMLTVDLALANVQTFVGSLHERLNAIEAEIQELRTQCNAPE